MSCTCDKAREVVRRQADDGGLWAIPATIMEAYLQQALRHLTAAVEGDDFIYEATFPIEDE